MKKFMKKTIHERIYEKKFHKTAITKTWLDFDERKKEKSDERKKFHDNSIPIHDTGNSNETKKIGHWRQRIKKIKKIFF